MNKNCVLKYGEKFGKLTVLSYNSKKKAYVCKCDCGGSTHAKPWQLKSGRHSSCKCGLTALRPKACLPNNLGAKRNILRGYKGSAKRRKHEFSLTDRQFFILIESDCHYCGEKPKPFSVNRRQTGFSFNGVDRVDNNIGYIKENCVPCCDTCNNSKSALSLEDWKQWINKIYNNLINK